MPKRIKIILYVILILAIIAVVWLMAWNRDINTEIATDIETLTWENVVEITENIDTQDPTFEEDVMNDLEWFFGANNWYEDVEWEFWFNTPEDE